MVHDAERPFIRGTRLMKKFSTGRNNWSQAKPLAKLL
jgi:hypothetical protein